jgi:hypothetical protein
VVQVYPHSLIFLISRVTLRKKKQEGFLAALGMTAGISCRLRRDVLLRKQRGRRVDLSAYYFSPTAHP